MVSGTQDNPPSQDNFIEHLYENCVNETKLALLDYAYILRLIFKKISIIICPSFIVVRLLLSILLFAHSEDGLIILTEQ